MTSAADIMKFMIQLIVSWTLFVCGLVRAEDVSIGIVNSARCQVRCLSLLPQGSAEGLASLLEVCQQDVYCSDCSRPCSIDRHQQQQQSSSASASACDEGCVGGVQQPAALPTARQVRGTGCRESCRFLRQVNSIRPGTCPPETQATGVAALCMKGCTSDADCDGSGSTGGGRDGAGGGGRDGGSAATTGGESMLLKCCSNGCGWTCQRPTHVYDGMPDTADAPLVVERPLSDGVELTWRSLASNATGPLLYLVEVRSNVARNFNDAEMSPWHLTMQTTAPQAAINHLKPGHWYQFRVAAANIYGSRGWSVPSQRFRVSREPQRPDRPSNLTEGDTLVIDGKVAVTVHWSPPKNTDLPISRYKVFWSKRLKTVSAQLQALQEMHRVISGDQLSFQLTDLDPDTTYFVQVQAIVHHGDLRLKSEKGSISIVTYPLTHSADQVISMPTVAVVTDNLYPAPISPQNVAVQRIYFQNGLLRANVSWNCAEVDADNEPCDKVLIYWSPEMCASETGVDEPLAPLMSATTHDSHFVVYDLRFACRYLIRLQPVSVNKVTGEMAVISLSTPYCWQTLVIGEIRPDCPRNAARLPEEPPNLESALLVGTSDITAKITWGAPHVPVADPPITGYQVIWGPVLPQSHHLLLDRVASDNRELPRDVRSIVISVDDDTNYVVYVRAVSRYGHGRIASLRFSTPQLEPPTSLNPPYFDVGTTTRTNNVHQPFASSPTPQYIFIGFTSPSTTKRGRNNNNVNFQSSGHQPPSMYNDVAVVPASPSVPFLSTSSSPPGLPSFVSRLTKSLLSILCASVCLLR